MHKWLKMGPLYIYPPSINAILCFFAIYANYSMRVNQTLPDVHSNWTYKML